MHLSPVAHLMLQIVAIVALSRGLARALRRVGQPPVIAEVIAGLLLGPSALGALAPGAFAALFPADTLPLLGALSQLGLVFFMFLVGLEFDPSLLRGRERAAAAVGAASIATPLALGMALALALPADLRPPGVPLGSFALFFGASMSVTAFPVLARILGDRGMLHTPVGSLALACAALNDVAAWCLLAVVVAVVGSSGAAAGALTTAGALAYVAAMVLLVRPLLARTGPRGATELSPELIAGAVVLVMLSATATELIGVHALFGGFALGAVMPRRGGLTHALISKLEDFVSIVLLPLFFAWSGLRAEIGLLSGVADWAAAGVIVGVACAGKLGGSALAARLLGMPWRDSVAVGVLMNTRGLMELIVLHIGLDLGVISPRLFAMMVLMALVTTAMTTPLLHRLQPGRRRDLPTGVTTPVLVCVSDPAVAPALLAVAAAARAPTQPVLGLHVIPGDRDSTVLDAPPERSAPLDALDAAGRGLGLAVTPLSFVSGDVASDIHSLAGDHRAALVLLGVHRSVLGDGALRGVVGRVTEHPPAPVGVLLDRGLRRVRAALALTEPGPDGDAVVAVADRLVAGGCRVERLPAAATPEALRAAAHTADLVVTTLDRAHGEAAPDWMVEDDTGFSVLGVRGRAPRAA